MPTVPARRSILTGRRVFPFNGWHPYHGLIAEPGWAPIANPDPPSRARCAAPATGRATPPTTSTSASRACTSPFRRSFDRFERLGGQIGGTPRACRMPSCGTGSCRCSTARRCATASAATSPTAATPTTRHARSLRACSGRRPLPSSSRGAGPSRSSSTPTSRTSRGPRRGATSTCTATRTTAAPSPPAAHAPVDSYLAGRSGQLLLQRMRALYAAEVTMTDMARRLPRPPARAAARARDDRDARVRPRLPRRPRPDLEDLDAPAPCADPVPLIVVDPGRRRAGRSSGYFASTHDVGPTILSMAGVRCRAAWTASTCRG